jgi:RNA polymerase sigma-70 factor (ECF subfamily)
MGCSKGTIMSRLFHARKNMQRQLVDLVDRAPANDADEDDAAASGSRS